MRNGMFHIAPAADYADQRKKVESLWRALFSDPSQWWDHRLEKVNSRYPDFKHKDTKEALWLNGKWKPGWVEAELAAMPPRSVQVSNFSYNIRLARYVNAGLYNETIEFFQQIQQEGLIPDKFSFVPVLNACASLQAIEQGRCIHTQIIRSGCESDVYVGSSLVDMYSKCGSLEDALRVFNGMPVHDVVAWNAMILGCVKCGQAQKALELSEQMQREQVEPVAITFVGILNACARAASLQEGRHVHEQIIQRGFESDVFVGSSLIDMYAKCGSIEDAWKVFMKMPTLDVVVWNTMIQGYVRCQQGQKALDLSRHMLLGGIEPDTITFASLLNACANVAALDAGRHFHEQIIQRGWESDMFVGSSLVGMYAKCGNLEDAWKVFNKMPTHSVFSWNAMILGYVKCKQAHQAFELYQLMQQEGVEPDPVTFVGLLNACATIAAIETGSLLHQQIIEKGYEADLSVGNCLIDMYAKCGSLHNALSVFERMNIRDLVSWNTMILGCVKCGQEQKALTIFYEMQLERVQPDSFTFVGVLNACANVAALDEGRVLHQQITERGLESDVFVGGCLVDMYGKCGSIEDAWRVFNRLAARDMVAWNAMILGYVRCGQGHKALELFRRMQQEGVAPDSAFFKGCLGACASVGAHEEGRYFHEQIVQTGYDSGVLVGNSLIDMYAKCGSIENALKVFQEIPECNGVSWNAMLGGYAIHGQGNEALGHFERMCGEGIEVNWVTFVSLLSACSHSGLVDEGLHCFESMRNSHRMCATVEHYACMLDLMGRAGRLHEAEDLMKIMPFETNSILQTSLVRACRTHCNMELGERIAKQILQLNSENAVGYVLLSNIYAAANKWDRSGSAQPERLEKNVEQYTWIEVNNKMLPVKEDYQSHPHSMESIQN